ncbi:hypothetical protein [Helicobacter rodentium]|uniref:hypothetical protein n=1 Tax=Helicobacter rodentium TaxID=59617 RepID=UPI0023525376|nr:hypothetical protein [Helicobacter rodentium]
MKKLFFSLLVASSLASISYAEDWLSLFFGSLFGNNVQENFNAEEIQQENRRISFETNNSKIYANAWKKYQNNPNRCPINRWGQPMCKF